MKCPKCQAENKDGAKFCHSCGETLTPKTELSESSGVTKSGSNQKMEYAGFGVRFVGHVIDSVILYVVRVMIFAVFSISATPVFYTDNPSAAQILTTAGFSFSVVMISIAIGWLYKALMESSPKQATVGKMAMGIKVTDMKGDRLTFAHASGRYFAHIITGMTLGIGYLTILFTEKKQAVHDLIANTLVVKNS